VRHWGWPSSIIRCPFRFASILPPGRWLVLAERDTVDAGSSSLRPEDLRSRYDHLPDFLDLARRLDPSGKFCNAYTAGYLGAA
jgi:hypothetical protein